uniref:C3HC4 type zinc finger protein n=1 Tax=Marseillevirus LCMAC103 TaxID=2506604 RepID=A0A481YUM4_9VIRU|nr:MAG: C3HC4 type zinc finger protein [Marseillevirus LCMAC103]
MEQQSAKPSLEKCTKKELSHISGMYGLVCTARMKKAQLVSRLAPYQIPEKIFDDLAAARATAAAVRATATAARRAVWRARRDGPPIDHIAAARAARARPLIDHIAAARAAVRTPPLQIPAPPEAKDDYGEVAEAFTCGICFECFGAQRIYQCASGHSMCHKCAYKLPGPRKTCPTCRAPLTGRNIGLENAMIVILT